VQTFAFCLFQPNLWLTFLPFLPAFRAVPWFREA
jgi:hypothetical protein